VIQNPSRYPDSTVRQLRPWLEAALDQVAPASGDFTVRFVNDRQMRQLNSTYRQRDSTTDVLSFPGAASALESHLGDVVISVPVARRQAAAAGHPVERELRLLILHGMLHCLGYDHEIDDGQMEQAERQWRQRLLDG